MKNILHIFLISCFSLTVISCAAMDHEHDSTANTTIDTTTINFVGGTASGFVLTSADGTNWTLRETAATNAIYGVIYAFSRFVAVGDDGVILNSSNGTSWNNGTSGTLEALTDVTYGYNIFVAVGASGTSVTSSDGVTWTATSNILHQSAFYAITSK